jgi:uncharacterized protein (TIGR02284 family)
MNSNDKVLQNILRIAESGHAFFQESAPRVVDPEVRTAFNYLKDVKGRFISALAPLVTKAEPVANDRTSPAAIAERMYTDVQKNFRSDAPASVANMLALGEKQLMKLTARAFEDSKDANVRQLLKSFYAEFSLCSDTMFRLQSRLAA